MITPAGRRILDFLRRVDPTPEQLELPWGGRSPRELTRAAQAFNFQSLDDDATASADDLMLDEQCRRHLHGS